MLERRRFTRLAWRWFKRGMIACIALCALGAVTVSVAWRLSPFPVERLDRWAVSPHVRDRDGRTMLRLVGEDDQWRRPVPLADMSPWLVAATIAVEDERFYDHPGVDALAVARAMAQNIAAMRIKSGASTLTMQVCRMMDDRRRTVWAKMAESLRALQLERLRTKDEILELYLNVAPYGANLRGVEAAARAYFGKGAADLSLAEAALLAGLPQSPQRYRPDRHPHAARIRRETVLRRMAELGVITESQAGEAAAQPVTLAAAPMHDLSHAPGAMHAAWLALQRRPQGGTTTIDLALQRDIARLVKHHITALPRDTDAAVVVIDIETADIVALIGSARPDDPVDGQVNGATALRSPGSALKPFIFAAAFEAKRLNEASALYDGPIQRGGWSPRNFDGDYHGQVTVTDALRQSLNVPAIVAAEGVGLARCIGVVEAAGVRLPDNTYERGGLAVVTGAVEVSLLDLTNAYATLGRGGAMMTPRLFSDEVRQPVRVLSTQACAMLADMLSSHARRPRGTERLSPDDVPWFMWKTGTSSGRRDAWAVGHNGRYAIGVWIGRFSGAGDAAYIGAEAAEPLLARLFALPSFRCDDAPPPATSWAVADPLPAPVEQSPRLRIISPGHQATFIALNGGAIVHAAVNAHNGVTWFLDGRLVESNGPMRLVLSPGRHALRCVSNDGQTDAVTIDVR